jgi:integrase
MAVERNAPMKVLAGWMGHSNIQITAKFYAHLEDAESRRVAQEIAAKGPSKVVGISERAAAQ